MRQGHRSWPPSSWSGRSAGLSDAAMASASLTLAVRVPLDRCDPDLNDQSGRGSLCPPEGLSCNTAPRSLASCLSVACVPGRTRAAQRSRQTLTIWSRASTMPRSSTLSWCVLSPVSRASSRSSVATAGCWPHGRRTGRISRPRFWTCPTTWRRCTLWKRICDASRSRIGPGPSQGSWSCTRVRHPVVAAAIVDPKRSGIDQSVRMARLKVRPSVLPASPSSR